MQNLLILFLLLAVYSFFTNLFSFLRTKYLYDEYKKYVFALASNTKYEGKITYRTKEIIRLFDMAGVQHPVFPNVVPVGYGQLARQQFDAFDNMFKDDQRIVSSVFSSFETAIGEYRNRFLNSINPLAWINTLIFLPRTILKYLGIKTDNLPTKILQLIYWMINVFYAVYSDKINPIIQSFLSKLFK